jgi:hypothetical protein
VFDRRSWSSPAIAWRSEWKRAAIAGFVGLAAGFGLRELDPVALFVMVGFAALLVGAAQQTLP